MTTSAKQKFSTTERNMSCEPPGAFESELRYLAGFSLKDKSEKVFIGCGEA